MGVTANSFQSYFGSATIADDVLRRMSAVLKFDLFGLVMNERARMGAGPLPYVNEVAPFREVKEPAYEWKSGLMPGSRGMEIIVHIEEYDEATQLKILKFLQQQPKR